ncbi:MAG: alanine racemase [bacterium]|nr:alanine racemase [bacterium]
MKNSERMSQLNAFLENGNTTLYKGELLDLVDQVLSRRDSLLEIAHAFGTPAYLFDEARLLGQIQRFQAAFAQDRRRVRTHYAFKANPTYSVVQTIQKSGLCADASSGLELELALRCGFEHIVFSGPAKTDEELSLAVQHTDRVTVHLDSHHERERLNALAALQGVTVRAGIRLNTSAHGLWTKFGIPLKDLPEFVCTASHHPHIDLLGVQFHLSWNRKSAGYQATLAELAPALTATAPPGGWKFIDIGGGYYPEDDEAVYPWMTPQNRLLTTLAGMDPNQPPDDWDMQYLLHPVQPIEEMARDILEAFERQLAPLGNPEIWLEPGRYLANAAVHLFLQIRDIKGNDVAITDGGTNLLGWEKLEAEHCPLINLTHPARTQRKIRVYGSLCTPHDLWGFTCYAEKMEIGDVLILPAQGSYVQTLSQRFIKPVCQTLWWDTQGETRQVSPEERFEDRYPEFKDK